MEFDETAGRRSVNAVEVAQPSFKQACPDGGSPSGKVNRYTWPFNPVQSQNCAAEESHDRRSSPSLEEELSSSEISAILKLQVPLAARSREAAPSTRSTEDLANYRRELKRAHSHQAGKLSTIMEKKYVEIATVAQNRGAAPKVKRWDARTRTTSVWDSLRRDSELFMQRGNCSIHLYEKGQSRRGPSLKIPIERIYSARFASLFTLFHIELARHDDFEEDELHRQRDLYIPAPDSSRKEAFSWHVTTRNFFAFILGRPVVGAVLGQALIDLRARLDFFRPNDPRNHDDFMAYLERLGYLELAHCPDYALAMLNFAEHFKLRELWVDAFVHCVGMNEVLRSHVEFHHVSRVTHALIMRAYLEMDLHLGRVTKTLSNFLEDDLSPSHFGISAGARVHLDRFRTFLNEYYVAKFGYWPPPKRSSFSKSLYKSMYFDFRGLYDYLVDLDSTSSILEQKPASGGICVLQNVKAFDERHRLMPLPHPHPLLPEEPIAPLRSSGSRASLTRSLGFASKPDPAAELTAAREALTLASNSSDESITCAPLVKAYKRFEAESLRKAEEKVSMSDARKVRWLLIYATLQMLISVTRAPKEVRMTETTYPLCCLVTGTPPWESGTKALTGEHTPSVIPPSTSAKHLDIMSATPAIHPDCEMDDYISNRTSSLLSSTTSRRTSLPSMSSSSSPPNSSRAGVFRNASIRSIQTLSSSIGSISRRASSRRRGSLTSLSPSPTPLTRIPSKSSTITQSSKFSEIVVHGYGNGLVESMYVEPARFVPIEMSTESLPEIAVSQSSPPRFNLRSMSTPDVRPTSRRSSPPQPLIFEADSLECPDTRHKKATPEPDRSPLMDAFDRGLPGIGSCVEESSSHPPSIDDSSSPPNLSWSSSRASSPDSSDSSTTPTRPEMIPLPGSPGDDEAPSPISTTYTESTLLDQSPISPIDGTLPQFPAIAISGRKSMDLPMVVDIEEMSVYKPTGVPSVDTVRVMNSDEDDEFPDREASKRWSVANKTHSIPLPLKSSLRRTKTGVTAAVSKRSVRIKEEPAFTLSKFRGNGATTVVSH